MKEKPNGSRAQRMRPGGTDRIRTGDSWGRMDPPLLPSELPRRVIFQRRTGVLPIRPREKLNAQASTWWQWDSAHHGPVFPGCQRIEMVWVIGIWASREARAPARHHTWLYLLGRDNAPGGRRLEVNGDGQVLTLSFSR